MLADPKSRALVDNFASQWLMLRNLQEPHPDAGRLPELRQRAARRRSARETELFFESIMREDRSVLDLLNADYTFVNERLARHYGIPNVYGSHFRRVTLQQRRAPRPARPGQHPDGHVVSRTARRRCCAASGSSRTSSARRRRRRRRTCPTLERERGRRGSQVAARAAGGAPREAGVRELPPRDGPARLRARELRRHRRVAGEGSRAARSTRRGQLADGTPGGRPGGAAQGAA